MEDKYKFEEWMFDQGYTKDYFGVWYKDSLVVDPLDLLYKFEEFVEKFLKKELTKKK